jgi:hypothetical protein
MHHQDLAPVEVQPKVFRTPGYAFDSAAGQSLGEVIGKRKAQVATAHVDTDEALTDKRPLQAGADRFDFR